MALVCLGVACYNYLMKQILLATTNPGKVATFKKILSKLGYEGLSMADLGLNLQEPAETKTAAEAIAIEKATEYAKQYRDLPVLARDDTMNIIGIAEEDDPKDHAKEFVAQRAGEYNDQNGEIVFAELARKYGGELPMVFNWGYALAWYRGDELKVVSTLVMTNPDHLKLVAVPSPKKVPGFCFAPILKVFVDGQWKYDSELTDEENWSAYQSAQADGIAKLLRDYES